jgi:hypothetical protein
LKYGNHHTGSFNDQRPEFRQASLIEQNGKMDRQNKTRALPAYTELDVLRRHAARAAVAAAELLKDTDGEPNPVVLEIGSERLKRIEAAAEKLRDESVLSWLAAMKVSRDAD